MRHAPQQVRSIAQVGEIVRTARKENEADQRRAAELTGVGLRFLGDLERGKETLRIGLVLKVLDRLGLNVWIAPRTWRP